AAHERGRVSPRAPGQERRAAGPMSEPVLRKSPKAKQPPAKKRPASAGPTASAEAAVGKIAPARLAAFEILTSVGEGKGHSDQLLHSALMETLSPEDRN